MAVPAQVDTIDKAQQRWADAVSALEVAQTQADEALHRHGVAQTELRNAKQREEAQWAALEKLRATQVLR